MTQVKRVRHIRPNASAISWRFLVAFLSSDESLLRGENLGLIVVKNTANLIAGTLARLYNTCVMTHEHKEVHSPENWLSYRVHRLHYEKAI